jgi:hypothetical protein
VRGPSPPLPGQVAQIEEKLPQPPDKTSLELRVRFVTTSIINRDGALYKDAAFGSRE